MVTFTGKPPKVESYFGPEIVRLFYKKVNKKPSLLCQLFMFSQEVDTIFNRNSHR